MSDPNINGVAIIGMAGRFPKARNIEEFWRNLCAGAEGISFFTEEELQADSVAIKDPRYVKARGVLDGADLFDAAFFGVNPREAEIMDPQHRVFLECAWEALENAGYDPGRFDGSIGVFAGMSMNTYLAANLRGHESLMAQVGEYQAMLGNDKDFLPTRVSYKLNLKGPSVNIQTACSTSLVAVCIACQNLLSYECDMALSGAVAISFPQKRGYLYQEGGIVSPDGHCRAFDAKAAGTVAGEGVGVVVLKRASEALADGDTIYAVIKGFAVNNDGSLKVGYTAPSVEGQAEAIATAQAMASFAPETVGYVEAHGTGTPLGDPIEIEGLTRAFRAGTNANQFCALGSVKSNIGHLDTAAGVAGLIKTALALHHKVLPPSLHFDSPNPKIDFQNSPFVVNRDLREWLQENGSRRAGVSSFGIGGTNAHVVLEEAPTPRGADSEPGDHNHSSLARVSARENKGDSETNPPKKRPVHLLVLSARTATALDKASVNLANQLGQDPGVDLGDVAFTLQLGRREFPHRKALVCHDVKEALERFSSVSVDPMLAGALVQQSPSVAFMFPGQGAQHVDMAKELYSCEKVFQDQLDRCCEILNPHLGFDLRDALYPHPNQADAACERLKQTAVTQPALFVVEYSLAQLWMSWGVRPEVMIGHSIGEYVAACLAGVFAIEDALALVSARGRMMQALPPGAMLAVRLPESEARPLLGRDLSMAAVNGASLCVISGEAARIDSLEKELSQRSTAATRLHTSHAFHSSMMEPMLKPFAELVSRADPKEPNIPYISGVTGTWITAEQATDPSYWALQMRQTVRFADGLGELLNKAGRILLEVGPGQTLTTLAKQHPATKPESIIVPSQRRPNESKSDCESLLRAVGQLWLSGVSLDWRALHAGGRPRRVSLPTYPFERKRYWVEPPGLIRRNSERPESLARGTENWPAAANSFEARARDRGIEGDGSSEEPLDRKGKIASSLASLFGDLSGRHLGDVSGDTTFIEMGFDSLFLTQASLSIEKMFNVQIAFRDLIDGLSTFQRLAAHLASALPDTERQNAPGGVSGQRGQAGDRSIRPGPETTVKSVGLTDAPGTGASQKPGRNEDGDVRGGIRRRLDPSRAEELLGRLNELSDSEVDALLCDPDLRHVLT